MFCNGLVYIYSTSTVGYNGSALAASIQKSLAGVENSVATRLVVGHFLSFYFESFRPLTTAPVLLLFFFPTFSDRLRLYIWLHWLAHKRGQSSRDTKSGCWPRASFAYACKSDSSSRGHYSASITGARGPANHTSQSFSLYILCRSLIHLPPRVGDTTNSILAYISRISHHLQQYFSNKNGVD